MADFTDKIQDVKNEIKGLDTGRFAANLAEEIWAIATSFSILANGLKILGVEESILGDLQKKSPNLLPQFRLWVLQPNTCRKKCS
ncbi:MAG: hypothetical protein LBP85_03265 [Prevotellaceae bacterium]|jgi:hypothetical protein|nr:hypothetical protein [Prevotellaceae bacterium]